MATPIVRSASFPVVGPRGVEFPTLHVERLVALDRNERFAIAPGYPDVIDILLDARAADPPAGRLDGVSAVFSGKGFGGKSYGLALAIADQRARRPGASAAPVIATGCIVPRGSGAVGGVEGFAAKVEAVIAHVAGRSEALDFAFPTENWLDADPAIREGLEQAQQRGELRLLPCKTVYDAAILWRVIDSRKRHRIVFGTLAGVALSAGGLAAAWGYYDLRDARACRASAAALPAQAPPPADLARAVRACERATHRQPGDARLHFLFAQTLALNGSEAMAGDEWKRAADLGDVDGMAAHGRRLWQSRPDDRSTVAAALVWLKRAAAAGSAAATEDIGYVLMDGRIEPRDPNEAQQWLVKARALRAAQAKKD